MIGLLTSLFQPNKSHLSPAGRAFVAWLEIVVLGTIAAGASVGLDYLNGHPGDIAGVFPLIVSALVISILKALSVLSIPRNQPQMPAAVDTAITQGQPRLPQPPSVAPIATAQLMPTGIGAAQQPPQGWQTTNAPLPAQQFINMPPAMPPSTWLASQTPISNMPTSSQPWPSIPPMQGG